MTNSLSSTLKGGGLTLNFSNNLSASIFVATHDPLFVDVPSGLAVSADDVSPPLEKIFAIPLHECYRLCSRQPTMRVVNLFGEAMASSTFFLLTLCPVKVSDMNTLLES